MAFAIDCYSVSIYSNLRAIKATDMIFGSNKCQECIKYLTIDTVRHWQQTIGERQSVTLALAIIAINAMLFPSAIPSITNPTLH